MFPADPFHKYDPWIESRSRRRNHRWNCRAVFAVIAFAVWRCCLSNGLSREFREFFSRHVSVYAEDFAIESAQLTTTILITTTVSLSSTYLPCIHSCLDPNLLLISGPPSLPI